MSEPFVLRYTATEADIETMHHYLSTDTYWAKGVSHEVVARSVANSLLFLVDDPETETLVAFARVITDEATFAYLCDVYVVSGYRGQGVGKRLMEGILTHPDLQNLHRFLLFTLDAHGLYVQYGFAPLEFPDRAMARTGSTIQ